MSLHNGIDTVAFVSLGLYTKTYGASEQSNINSLFVSLGLLEEAGSGAALEHYWINTPRRASNLVWPYKQDFRV